MTFADYALAFFQASILLILSLVIAYGAFAAFLQARSSLASHRIDQAKKLREQRMIEAETLPPRPASGGELSVADGRSK